MDPTRRIDSTPAGRTGGRGPGIRLGLIAAGALAALACSNLSNTSDGIATLDVRLPANFYLEKDRPITLSAVARSADGDSVAATIAWRAVDTTIAVDSASGTITALYDLGRGRVQVAIVGGEAFATGADNLAFTLTAQADTFFLDGADSVDVAHDPDGAHLSGLFVQGGSPLAGVAGRPVTFAIVDPTATDSPSVVLTSSFGVVVVDSTFTDANGQAAALTVVPFQNKRPPDRVVIEANAYRANGDKIPGSGARIVVRFLHQ